MFSENHPTQTQTFFSGASYDTDPISTFSAPNSGKYIDSHNMEPTSNEGNTRSMQKIRGEVLLYDNTTALNNYKCIGSIAVNDYIVEFWAHASPGNPGIIRVNGTIMLSSVDFAISQSFPLYLDKSESSFSEVYVSDKNIVPFVFNVQDIVDSFNASSDKYFTAFDPLLYQINIQSSLDIVTFIELVNVGGGGGAPVGHYDYQMRYVTVEGDRTQLSHPSPLIPIMESLSSASRVYPWVKTFSAPPNPASVTSLAPHLRFRVTNLYNYDYIEIIRREYNTGAGIQYTPTGKIVARISVAPGEISVRDYIDWQESNVDIALSDETVTNQLAHIKNAGPVKYYNRRLVFSDIELESLQSNPTFIDCLGLKGFPIIDNLHQAGHKDPWNHVYRKTEMRGERAGFGVNFYDCVGNKGFVSKIPDLENYQFPNRRDPILTASSDYSYQGYVTAATTATRTVGGTHEAFDLSEAAKKGYYCEFKNITKKHEVVPGVFTGAKSTSKVTSDCNENTAEIEGHGAKVETFGQVTTWYHPYHPVNKFDGDTSGHEAVVNNKVATESIFTLGQAPDDDNKDSHVKQYDPYGFAPCYFSMGMMIGGIDNIPVWAKSFSIVRTPSAGRVVCQGLGFYSLRPAAFDLIGNDNLAGKDLNKFWYYSPDIAQGIVSSETVNDIIQNPQNYKLQFVSPLGFFSEYYSAQRTDPFGISVEEQRDKCVDMITYVRMLRDSTDNPQINPGESSMGIPGGDGYSYIDYEIFRNNGSVPTPFVTSPYGGNKLVDLTGVLRVSEGRGDYLQLISDETIYRNTWAGGVNDTNFGDSGAKSWTEPMYIINIVRDDAQIKDIDKQPYRATPHYQKLESIIGKSNGNAGQVFKLVDERWDDCIPAPQSTYYGASTDRFLYVKLTDNTVQKWVNVTYYTTSQVNSLSANISVGGGVYNGISGMYTHTNVGNKDRFFEINFNVSGSVPPLDSLILVRYDNTAPIRVFGGDTFLGEAIFAPLDRESSYDDSAADTQFAFGNALPYKTFKINPRHYTIKKAGSNFNEIQQSDWFTLGYIRQLCAMFTCESRAAIHLAYSNDTNDPVHQHFPQIHYIMRPNRWTTEDLGGANIFPQYANDYGGNEAGNWRYGGLRFTQLVNPDYSVQSPIAFFSKPGFGFVERTKFPNMVMWSLQRGINQQNSPGLKTFPANNSYVINDASGRIVYEFIDTTDKGENIYVICEKKTCLLITRKTILSGTDAATIGLISTDSFITDEYWLNNSVGSPDMMWRGISEAFVPITLEGGAQIKNKALFIPNKESVYRFMDNQVVDIGRIDYHSRIYTDGISKIKDGLGTHVTSIFDNYKQQYYLFIRNDDDLNNMAIFVFSQKNNTWIGTNGFNFDRFTTNGNKTYGHKDMMTYELNQGDVINGNPINATLTLCHAPEPMFDKEMIRVRINSSNKPVSVEFYKAKGDIAAFLQQCSLTASQLKDYVGYEQYVPRIDVGVNPATPRFQSKLIITKIVHNLAEDFKISDFTVQYKKIKT